MRELVRAYQAVASYDAKGYRLAGSDLTQAQADVIFTLGNTEGMTCGEIGEKTLITKGTLTGVLDRLEQKTLIKRQSDPEDGRRIRIILTSQGEQLFEQEFPRQLEWMGERFMRLNKSDRKAATQLLAQIRDVFQD